MTDKQILYDHDGIRLIYITSADFPPIIQKHTYCMVCHHWNHVGTLHIRFFWDSFTDAEQATLIREAIAIDPILTEDES